MLDLREVEERRKKLGLSFQQAADRAGFNSRAQWWNIEKGNSGGTNGITLGLLDKLATALECSPCDLLLKRPSRAKAGR